MVAAVEDAVYQRVAAWHGEGTVVDGDLRSWAEVKAHLNIGWDLQKVSLFTASVQSKGFGKATNFSGVRRTDTAEVIAVNAADYPLVTIDQFGQFVEEATQDENVSWDAFCILLGGRAFAATMKLDEPITVPGDPSPIFPYVGFSNRIDSKGSLVADPTAIRQVCYNTNSVFLIKADQSGWSDKFRHYGRFDLGEAAEQVRSTLNLVRVAFNDFGEWAKVLSEKKIDTDAYINGWLPIHQGMSDRVATRVETKREFVRAALGSDRSPERQDTAWAFLQAGIDAYQYAFPVKSSADGGDPRMARSIRMMQARKGWGGDSSQTHDLRRLYTIVNDLVDAK